MHGNGFELLSGKKARPSEAQFIAIDNTLVFTAAGCLLPRLAPLLQEVPICLGQLLVIVGLESKPSLLICPDLWVRELGFLVVDELDLVSAACAGSIGKQLSVAGLV